MVIIRDTDVGKDRDSYDQLWETVIAPEIESYREDFDSSSPVFTELKMRLNVYPDAKELIWKRYCYYNSKCKMLYMAPPEDGTDFLLDRHKIAACYMAAIVSVQPIVLFSKETDEPSSYPISEFLAITTGLSILRSYLEFSTGQAFEHGILYPPKSMVQNGNYTNNFARELHFAYLDGSINLLSLAHELFLLEIITLTGVGESADE